MSKIYLTKHEFIMNLNQCSFDQANKFISFARENQLQPVLSTYRDLAYFTYYQLYTEGESKEVRDKISPLSFSRNDYLKQIITCFSKDEFYFDSLMTRINRFNDLYSKYKNELDKFNKFLRNEHDLRRKKKRKWALTVLQYSNMPDWAKEYLSQ